MSRVKVRVPSALRQYVDGQNSIQVQGETVREAIDDLIQQYPDLKNLMLKETGEIRNHINIYLNDDDIQELKHEQTQVNEGDTIYILPSVAGGSNPTKPNGSFAEKFGNLSREEVTRYSRHLLLPQVGIKGQQKLKNSSVLIVGMGGLGSPLGLYLAAAGVGTIGLIDGDVVDLTNLQRQIIHSQ